MTVTRGLKLLQLVEYFGISGYLLCSIDLRRYGSDLLPQALIILINKLHLKWLLAELDYRMSKISCPDAAIGPMRCENDLDPQSLNTTSQKINLSLSVAREVIDCYD